MLMPITLSDDGTLAAFGIRCLLDEIILQTINPSCRVWIVSAEMSYSCCLHESMSHIITDKQCLIIMVELGRRTCPQKIPRLINDRIFYVDGELALSDVRIKLQYLLKKIIMRKSREYRLQRYLASGSLSYQNMPPQLSRAERLVLDFLFKGYSATLISDVFGLKKSVVSQHKRNGMRKLGVNTLQSLYYLHCLRHVTNSYY